MIAALAARIIRDVAELRTVKRQRGHNMYVAGGATIVASLLNEDLIDDTKEPKRRRHER